MTSLHDNSRYNVFTTEQFERLWENAVDVGVIDAAVGKIQLDGLISLLAIGPYDFRSEDTIGEFVDIRRVDFMPDANPSVEIWYSVVEDDRAVYLVSVELIYPAQQRFPGFDF